MHVSHDYINMQGYMCTWVIFGFQIAMTLSHNFFSQYLGAISQLNIMSI